MDANFERAKGSRRAIDRLLMNGEWPVLLGIMGKGEGDGRYLSVAEVRALFAERRLPERIARGLHRTRRRGAADRCARSGRCVGSGRRRLHRDRGDRGVSQPREEGGAAAGAVAAARAAGHAAAKAAYWLDQNWSTGDRHWFHHASQGTATFPVPYSWFVALEQAGLHLFSRPAC